MDTLSKRLRPGWGTTFRSIFILAAVLFCMDPSPGLGQTQGRRKVPLTISGDVTFWLPQFDGVMQVGTDVDPGTPNRLDRHLDLEEHPEVFEFGIALGDIRYGRLSAGFLRFTAPGNKVLTRDVTFAGVTFDVPETVHTDFKVDIDRITVSYIQDFRGAYILTYEIGMAFFRWKASIENRHIGKRASEDANATLPLTGLHAIFPLGDAFRIQLGFTGVFFNTSGDDVTVVDTYGEFNLALAKYLILGFGYRYLRLDGELDLKGGKTGELEFTLGGVFFTIGLKF
ncbi:MAG: hypothetical protein ACYTHM_07855 [Planctomycetota bacterium]|jgi:hypothetical protein